MMTKIHAMSNPCFRDKPSNELRQTFFTPIEPKIHVLLFIPFIKIYRTPFVQGIFNHTFMTLNLINAFPLNLVITYFVQNAVLVLAFKQGGYTY